jgi:YidC/Oxa1 family membrane protein insertase
MAKRFLVWLIIFFSAFLILEQFNPPVPEEVITDDFVISTERDEYTLGNSVQLSMTNYTDEDRVLSSYCPGTPLEFSRYERGEWFPLVAEGNVTHAFCDEVVLSARSEVILDLGPWKESFFYEAGKYKVSLNIVDSIEVEVEEESKVDAVSKGETYFAEFELKERGFFTSFLMTVFYKPIYNILVFITEVLPGHILTLAIRFLLLSPSQKALKSQRAMQKIQPEIDALKKKYKGQQEKIAQETMSLFKKHRVSPLNSCLPILIQFPILIGLFYVVRDGLSPYDTHLLYDFLVHADLSLYQVNFLGVLDLSKVNYTWLPLLVGLLQFCQMKLTFAKSTSKGKSKVVDIDKDGKVVAAKKKNEEDKTPDPMKMMSKTMVYFLPIMIAFMTASLPAGVGLYWGVTTSFGIIQQLFVNRSS